jgi:tRNA pseudouridine38-40 synthase
LRFFLEIVYKGTHYHGWQRQENALSVQEVIEDKLAVILREKAEITGSGRTDTGVHALQQYAHIDLPAPLTGDMLFRLNCLLPKDIAIKNVFRVKDDVSARHDACLREYEYIIIREKDPFSLDQAWVFSKDLDIEAMNKAAGILKTFEVFESFCKVKTDVPHFRCDIKHARWEESGKRLIFTISANRFLRGMVRAIVGTLIDVGLKKISPETMPDIISAQSRSAASAAAPPQGLFLKRVQYPDSVFIGNKP